MSKQTLAFIMTWTNATNEIVNISGLEANGNDNWNDNNGGGANTLNQWYALQPGQSVTITSNVVNCKDHGFQYVSLANNGQLFAQTFLVWNPDNAGGNAIIQTVSAVGQGNYSEVDVQVNMSDNSYSYPWGAALCYLGTAATDDINGNCLGSFASGSNADANMTLNGSVSISGLAPENVSVLGLVVNY